MAGERFERRLAEGNSAVTLRGELGRMDGRLRQDLSQMEVRIIREIRNSRFDFHMVFRALVRSDHRRLRDHGGHAGDRSLTRCAGARLFRLTSLR